MGLYIGQKSVVKTKAIIVLVAIFALVAIPTFVSVRSHIARADDNVPPKFLDSIRYVRANTAPNQHDIAVEVEFYKGTTQINLKIDDVPVPAENAPNDPTTTQTFSTSDSNKLVVRMPFRPGPHTFTGTAMVNGTEVPIRGANGEERGIATVFALAPAGSSETRPAATYLHPSSNMQPLSSNKPVRIKLDDEFEQLKSIAFSIHTGTHDDQNSEEIGIFSMTRSQCEIAPDDYLECDIQNARNVQDGSIWSEKLKDNASYFIKLNTSTKAATLPAYPDGIAFNNQRYWSLPFTIDKTDPWVTLDGPLSMVGGETLTIKGTVDPTALSGILYVGDEDVGRNIEMTGNGTWSYTLTTDKLGDHKIMVLAKDLAENTSTATTVLTVNPFIPAPAEVQKVNDGAIGLTTPFAEPQALTKEDIPPAPATVNSDMGVLGAHDAMNSKIDQEKVIAAVAPSGEGWKLFGVAWFWWFFGAVALIGTSSWALASRRQFGMENI